MNLTRRERSIRVDLQTAAFVLSALGVIVALVAGTITYYNARTNLPAEAPNRFDDFVFLTMDKDGLFKFVRTDHPTSVYGKEVANPNTILWEGYTLAVHEPYDQLTVFRMVVSGHPQGLCHYFWWSEDQEGNRLKFQDGGHVQAALVPNRSPNAGLQDPRACRQIILVQSAMARIWQLARKEAACLAYRVATPRHCLKLQNPFSTKCRAWYKSRSYSRCSRRLLRGGITTFIPHSDASATI